jgi:outer membrane biosynthesis protein TonB
MHTELFHPDLNNFSDKKVPDSQGGTGGLAYGFDGAVGLAKQKGGKNIAESSRNIENILYWSLAMYYDKWLWSTGNPEDSSTLTTVPAKAASVDEEFQVEAAAKKGGSKKTTKLADPPKTEKPAEPPKTEAAPPKTEATVEPPKTDKPVDPPKTSATTPTPAPSSQAPPPESSSLAVPPPPASSQAAPPASSQASPPASSATPPESPISTQLPAVSVTNTIKSSVTSSVSGLSAPISGTALISGSNTASITGLHTSCSNTLCTLPSSSATPTSSEAVPQETFESEPMNAGSMTADEIIAIAGSIASEQVAAMALWDQALAEMGLPSETVESDPTASLGTGLPMATDGVGGVGNGTWTMPVLRAREVRQGVRERRMYDYAS